MAPARAAVRDHPVAAFLCLAFASSWAYGWLFLRYVAPAVEYPLSQIASLPFAWGPLVAAAVVVGARRTWLDRLLDWSVSRRALAGAFLLPVAVQDLPDVLAAALGDPVVAFPVSPAQYVLVFAFTLLLGGALEEFGWRGFMQDRLQTEYGALAAATAVGLAWAAWHYPLHAAGYTFARDSPALFAGYLVALSVVLAAVYNSTRGVLPVMVLHAAHNMPGFLAPADGAGSIPATDPVPFVAAGWAVLAVAAVAHAGASDLSSGGRPAAHADD